MTNSPPPPDPKRRRLLLAGLAGATAIGAGGLYALREGDVGIESRSGANFAKGPVPRRRLGRTGLEVGVIGIGGGGASEPAPLARAIDLGMNYLDTATCYGGSEETIGAAFATNPGLREKVVLATKWDPGAATPKERMLASLDESLRRMKTDRVEIMQIHWLGGGHRGISGDDGRARLDNPALLEAMDEAKKAGKVRFFGATSHDAQRSELLRYAIDKGLFDMILVKLNALDFEAAGVPELLAAARAADIGVVGMKSQPEGGLLPPGFEGKAYDVFQANLRWVLAQDLACVVHSKVANDLTAQDAAVAAVQEELTHADVALLEPYVRALSPHYCRGCEGGCHDACPDDVAIGPVLRARLYATQYGWAERARALYERLDPARRASERCLSCSACSEACPFGVDARGRVLDAAKIFSGVGTPRA